MFYKVQLGLITFTSLFFLLVFTTGFSALIGGLVSLINATVWYYQTEKQKKKYTLTAGASYRLLIFSLVFRMSLVAFLLIAGLKIGLQPEALIIGFIAGQIGFILDRGVFN